MSISVEAFLWHPYSILYMRQHQQYACNDEQTLQNMSGAHLLRPPRMTGPKPVHEGQNLMVSSITVLLHQKLKN